jgi:hypothetical protein
MFRKIRSRCDHAYIFKIRKKRKREIIYHRQTEMSTTPNTSSASSTARQIDDAFWGDAEDSEEDYAEVVVTFESACSTKIRFGTKHKGKTLGALVRSKSGRSYLRYLLDWDELFPDLRESIEFLMDAYTANTAGGKKRKREQDDGGQEHVGAVDVEPVRLTLAEPSSDSLLQVDSAQAN